MLWDGAMDRVGSFLVTYQRPIVTLLTVALLAIVYRVLTRALRRYMEAKAHKPENVQNFMFFWRYGWWAAATVLVLVSLSGSLAALGISAAFMGMILGWSLQAPVTGLAAWLMIILKRPFKIGDRVIIAGIIGDVVDISLTHVILNQVGGTIGGEEKSGRGVLIPNAILFQQIIYNYAFETSHILDEVVVNITFESDMDRAEEICCDAARRVTAQIVEETGSEPFIRAEIMDWGMRLRLRYLTLATERQRITSEISRIIFSEVRKDPRVEFCYPHSEVIYRPKGLPNGNGGGPPVQMAEA
jgi:small-conductance mechanosensitive channel